MSAMIEVTYVGGCDAVDVSFSTGRTFTVARGESVELMFGEAQQLDGNQEWQASETGEPGGKDK